MSSRVNVDQRRRLQRPQQGQRERAEAEHGRDQPLGQGKALQPLRGARILGLLQQATDAGGCGLLTGLGDGDVKPS